MNITTTGLHMDTGAALQAYVKERMANLKKTFEQVIDVHAAFTHEGHHQHLHHAATTVHANGITLHATGSGIDWYAALDEAATKLERQLDRYKGRLNKHRERRRKFSEHMKDVLPISIEDATVREDSLDGVPEDMFREFAPDVVKKEVSQIAPMSIDEAVMQMDLLHKPAYLFLNVGTGQLNMVYREGENTVRWIAPKAA